MADVVFSNTLIVCTFVFGWLVVSCLLPLYNKALFDIYPWPITGTMLQIIPVLVFLFFVHVVEYAIQKCRQDGDVDGEAAKLLVNARKRHSRAPPSFIVGPGFWMKFFNFFPVGVAFAGNIILTNVGISVTSVDVHVLLRASTFVWVIFFSKIVNRDPWPSPFVCLVALAMCGGIVLESWSSFETDGVGAWALVINLASSVFEALHIVLLRRATEKMGKRYLVESPPEIPYDHFNASPDDMHSLQAAGFEVGLPFQPMSAFEVTFLKTFLAMFVIVPAALLVELKYPQDINGLPSGTAWDIFSNGATGCAYGVQCVYWALVVGAGITLVFQSLIVACAHCAKPLSLAFLVQAKAVPSWIATFIFGGVTLYVCGCAESKSKHEKCAAEAPRPKCVTFSKFEKGDEFAYHVCGVCIILASVLVYAGLRVWDMHKKLHGVGVRKYAYEGDMTKEDVEDW